MQQVLQKWNGREFMIAITKAFPIPVVLLDTVTGRHL
jgi:hypothetical protein